MGGPDSEDRRLDTALAGCGDLRVWGAAAALTMRGSGANPVSLRCCGRAQVEKGWTTLSKHTAE